MPPLTYPSSLPAWARPDSGWRGLIAERGDRRIELTVIEDGILRLRYAPRLCPARQRSWAVIPQGWPDATATLDGSGEALVLRTPCLDVRIADDLRLTAADRSGTPILHEDPGDGFFETPGTGCGLQRRTPLDERFFGFGEKTGPLEKRGRSMVFWNTDPFDAGEGGYGHEADPLYLSVPFFIGLRDRVAYGLFTDESSKLVFDMASSSPTAYRITSASTALDQYLIAGPAFRDVVRRYTWLTGRMPLPPRWALGYHQSRWGYYPDSQLVEVCTELRRRGIPADGVWLDIQHLEGYRTFTWEKKGFPRPRELVASLEAMGFKTCVIVDPGIKVDPAWSIYREGVERGLFLEGEDGTPHVDQLWPGDSVFPDFTDPKARAWWSSLLATETDLGVRGIWLDMNEPATLRKEQGRTLPNAVPAQGEGTPATLAEIHNVYALQEARATFEGLSAARPDRRPFILTRAGFAGIQRYAAVWTGDAPSTWDTLRATLPMLLNLGLSGVPFVGSDVGGFSGKASAELYSRWMQLGALSPFFRCHTSKMGNRQEPWQFGAIVEDVCRAAIGERYRLLAYLYSLAFEAAQTGAPILRPLVYEFQDDPAVHAMGDEAMLGPWLLCAPVLEEGATARRVYLPPGRWLDLASGAVLEGRRTLDVAVTLGSIPTFLRAGAVLPTIDVMAWSDREAIRTLTFDLFPGDAASSFTLYEDDGDGPALASGTYSRVEVRLERVHGALCFGTAARTGRAAPHNRRFVVRLWGEHAIRRIELNGRTLPEWVEDEAPSHDGEGWFRPRTGARATAVFTEIPELTLRFIG